MTTYRIVAWIRGKPRTRHSMSMEMVKPQTVQAIVEFQPRQTLSGTHRKIGREIVNLLEANSVSYVTIEKYSD